MNIAVWSMGKYCEWNEHCIITESKKYCSTDINF